VPRVRGFRSKSPCSLAGWFPTPSARACICLPRGGTSWHPTPRALMRSTSRPPPPATRAPQVEREHHGIGIHHTIAPLHHDAGSAAIPHHHVWCAKLPRTPMGCPGWEQWVRRHGVIGRHTPLPAHGRLEGGMAGSTAPLPVTAGRRRSGRPTSSFHPRCSSPPCACRHPGAEPAAECCMGRRPRPFAAALPRSGEQTRLPRSRGRSAGPAHPLRLAERGARPCAGEEGGGSCAALEDGERRAAQRHGSRSATTVEDGGEAVAKFERYCFPVCLAGGRLVKEATAESGCRCRSSSWGRAASGQGGG